MQSSFSTPVEASFETLWTLLLDKIENPTRYVKDFVDSKILEKNYNGFLRETKTVRDELLIERITVDEKSKEIRFTLVDNPLFTGYIINKVETPLKEGEPLILTISLHHQPKENVLLSNNSKNDEHLAQSYQEVVTRIKNMAEEQQYILQSTPN